MASNITLSAGVRQNLLSLQKTADLMSTTQNRLATGKKVNSALDNPVNFFTSSSLQSRSNDLSALLDSMSNGIKTLEAADNGLTSITSTLQSMKSTLTQARQDKSFATQSFALDSARTGNLSFSGGAVGATGVDISLGGGTVTPTTLTGTGANFSTNFTGGTITVNGTNVTIRGDQAATATTFTNVAATNTGTYTGGTLSINGTDVTIADDSDAAEVKTAIDAAGITGLTVTNTAGTLSFSLASGADLTLTASSSTLAGNLGITDGSSATATSTNGTVAFDATATTVEADFDNAGITGLTASVSGGQVSLSLASGDDLTLGGSGTLLTAIGFGTGNTSSTNGTPSALKTVDALVTEINGNTSLKGKVVASNDGGKLRIQNVSTSDLTLTGVGSDGEVDGSTGTTDIAGNDVRKSLVTQFNDLKDQLDKFADDASFNGINLLRGDNLKLTFNETGTSTISIQAKKSDGTATSIDSAYLGISTLNNSDVDADTNIDSLLDKLTTALNTVRSQASTFGSSLSIVQNRQDFTKATINTLQTGADNLVLADSNEEAANLLALQTRQQLSSTALSLASQADQAVLRLF